MSNPKHVHWDLPDYLTEKLREPEKLAVEEHLKICPQCEAELEYLREGLQAAGEEKSQEPSAEYWTSILPRVRDRIQTFSTPTFAGGGWLSIPSRIERVLAPAAALALGILLVVHVLWTRSGEISREFIDQDLRTLVAALEEEELAGLIEPVVVPRSLLSPILKPDEDRLLTTHFIDLNELLAEDYSSLEPLDLSGASLNLESLSDQELEEVLRMLDGKLAR